METKEHNLNTSSAAGAAGWKLFYRFAGIGLLLNVGSVLLDMALSFQGGDMAVGSADAAFWFGLFQEDWFLGLRNLGLLNVINMLLTLPLYLVLYQLHYRRLPAISALALSLVLLGMAVYVANNRALVMLSLSQQWPAAGEAQKALLEAAGTAILAQAEDFTPGSFTGMFLSSAGSLLMMVVVLRGGVFARWTSLVGLLGVSCLLVFTTSVTFAPATFDSAMLLALLGGLGMLAWNIATLLVLFRLGAGRHPAAVPARVARV